MFIIVQVAYVYEQHLFCLTMVRIRKCTILVNTIRFLNECHYALYTAYFFHRSTFY